MKIIAHIYTDFPTKFGIPRQSGLVEELKGKIVFEPEYRNPEAVRGLEEYSYVWLLWKFSESKRDHWAATVKPPRLGGKKRVGVFATRSPYRPNDIGLSSVRLERVEQNTELGPVLFVAGIDLMNGTPIYDIKPYIPHVDSHPEAVGGFADRTREYELEVACEEHFLQLLPEEKRAAAIKVLRQDPRPAYDADPERIYGVAFAGWDIRFRVKGRLLTVCEIVALS
ncbi:tRNA (N6-threonylcarbamoyladenosine(37)-N6)-methyltransferase TrmO [Hespellia stercorisuis]|uniref:tRNA-Thr(GGU) m(6)t(6)A37 methyltransferase TsaA n=1 Tax=Hespellia stercorisuis DSM 15480 TaxID=1121950 RepID=A0A1M6PH23_9FIRM|nr:tRNA (N6-threonylcarbamoyladenosine(37)-N6)-methyltransferase TrmO [Hespellia stercorisuis]SHK07248.1 tRNA-Thr(GGU) m(6)t(6)A37 methyltransferase TsaA [Hespellia stercorisuis DSM 15480]